VNSVTYDWFAISSGQARLQNCTRPVPVLYPTNYLLLERTAHRGMPGVSLDVNERVSLLNTLAANKLNR